MLSKGLKALITCEVTDQFQQALVARGIQYELAGWGQTGEVLDDLQITAKAKDCDLSSRIPNESRFLQTT